MTPDSKRDEPRVAAGSGEAGQDDIQHGKDSATISTPQARRYRAEIVNPVDGKPRVWDTYATREAAEVVATTLRHHGFFVQVRRDDPEPQEDPFTSRRRFLIVALMAGWVTPERVVERVVAEVEREALAAS